MNRGFQPIIVGRGSHCEQAFERNARPLMGLEITNNSPEIQSLNFFSVYHRVRMRDSTLSVRSILGDTVYDDRELSILMDYIFESRAVRLYAALFNTNLLYGAFKGKRFGIECHHRNMYGTESMSFDLSQHVSKSDITKAEIVECFIADFHTEFSQTNIEPGERLIILFDLGSHEFRGMDIMMEKANTMFGAEKRRKILLTL